LGNGGWPSVSEIKKISTVVHAKLTIPANVVRTYQQANIKVFVFTARNESDYAKMIPLEPYGVVVNDVARFQRWRDATKGSA
jgi:glycerophosphoryl diester phosphodiesterase